MRKQAFQIQHKVFKNPNCQEADQLAIEKRGQGIETPDCRVTNLVGSQGGILNPGLRFQCPAS